MTTDFKRELKSRLVNPANPVWLLLFIALVFLPLQSWSQTEPVGTVLTASGDVIATSDGIARSLKRRDAVFEGDTISAGQKSRVRFKLTDDSTYVVQENSTFTIEKYNYNGKQDGSEIADFYFSEGVMEFVSGYIGKQDNTKFRIDTDFAAIGLRGSGGIITTGSSSTQVFVTLGQLTAVSKNGELFVMNNGQTTVLDAGGETRTEEGNSTGADQTMTTEGDDITAEEGDADDTEGSEEAEQEQAEQEEAASEEIQDDQQITADKQEEVEDANAENEGAVADAQVSAAEIYAELIPDSVEATQEDLALALNEAVEAYPVLYAELVNVAIDAGLEPPAAALTATEALGGASSISENVLTDIFVVSTQGLTETADLEAVESTLNLQGSSPLIVQGSLASPTTPETVVPSNPTVTPVCNGTASCAQ